MNTLSKQDVRPRTNHNKHDSCPLCKQPKLVASKICSECVSNRPPVNPFTYVVEGELCRLIPLTKGLYALVSLSDYDFLMRFVWYAAWMSNSFYAVRRSENKTELMHRVIVGAAKKQDVDHIRKRQTLDNRRSNLRPCSHSQNLANSKLTHKSGYRGVTWYKPRQKWLACIRCKNQYYHLGYFLDKNDAARAYNRAASELFGEFATLNVVV